MLEYWYGLIRSLSDEKDREVGEGQCRVQGSGDGILLFLPNPSTCRKRAVGGQMSARSQNTFGRYLP